MFQGDMDEKMKILWLPIPKKIFIGPRITRQCIILKFGGRGETHYA